MLRIIDNAAMQVLPMKIDDLEWVGRLTHILDAFRQVNQDVTANQILVLLEIGAKPGITQRELSQAVKLKEGTISRICAVMSDRGHQNRPGLNLIDIRPVPGDWRAKGQHLTAQGQRLYSTVKAFMTGYFEPPIAP